MVRVIFEYDESCAKWEVVVEGAAHPTEAKQAFNATVLTILQGGISIGLEHKVTQSTNGRFILEPAVRRR